MFRLIRTLIRIISSDAVWNKIERVPQYIRILIGVTLGIGAGLVISRDLASEFNDFGMLAIRFLKALATPLILFAVLDAFLRIHIPAVKGLKMVCISLVNAAVAIAIGLGVANVLQTGTQWKGHLEEVTQEVKKAEAPPKEGEKVAVKEPVEKPKLGFVKIVSGYIPENLVEPFGKNNVITVVLIAVLAGASLRRLKNADKEHTRKGLALLDDTIHVGFQTLTQMITWIIHLLPFAIFFVVAGVVGKTGPGIFKVLLSFLVTVILGLVLHAVFYYSLLLWIVARVSPRKFFAGAMDAIVTALSCGSSLATLPTTLKCLDEKLHVSPGSARLAACVGTNLNHDGIILYEAAATIFLAQALGMDLTIGQQLTVALASILAGFGIAGVPEAGLITLAMVLSAAGLPDYLVPLILPVDWIVGRFRAATNVISDMTVAQLLDKVHPDEPATAVPPGAHS
jgi:Na+/H+-dicarboxylate symporter